MSCPLSVMFLLHAVAGESQPDSCRDCREWQVVSVMSEYTDPEQQEEEDVLESLGSPLSEQ